MGCWCDNFLRRHNRNAAIASAIVPTGTATPAAMATTLVLLFEELFELSALPVDVIYTVAGPEAGDAVELDDTAPVEATEPEPGKSQSGCPAYERGKLTCCRWLHCKLAQFTIATEHL